jgi:hypothetical protein
MDGVNYDPVTADSLKEIASRCVWIALKSKIEDVPIAIKEMAYVIHKMQRIVTMREQGIDENEIINRVLR